MQFKTLTLLAAMAAALVAQTAIAATETPKTRAEVKAEAKAAAKSGDCYDAATAPKAKSEKTRAEVKAGAKGASIECEASPGPQAKSQAKRAIKAGEMPQGEGGVKK